VAACDHHGGRVDCQVLEMCFTVDAAADQDNPGSQRSKGLHIASFLLGFAVGVAEHGQIAPLIGQLFGTSDDFHEIGVADVGEERGTSTGQAVSLDSSSALARALAHSAARIRLSPKMASRSNSLRWKGMGSRV